MSENRKCLALRVDGRPSAGEAERLVRGALGDRADWGVLEIEIFPGKIGTLLLARPSDGMYIRRDALRRLMEKNK